MVVKEAKMHDLQTYKIERKIEKKILNKMFLCLER